MLFIPQPKRRWFLGTRWIRGTLRFEIIRGNIAGSLHWRNAIWIGSVVESKKINEATGSKSDAVLEEIKSSSPIDWRKTTGWRLGNDSNTILDEIYEKQGEFSDEWAKHEQRPHLCGKWLISWDGTFLSEVNHNLVVKLNTGCVQNVVTTERCGLGRARLGIYAEDFFFLEPVTLTPTWMRSISNCIMIEDNQNNIQTELN